MKVLDTFDQFYGSIYHDRWSSLRSALAEKPAQVKRFNLFLGNSYPKVSDPVASWALNCFSVERTFRPQVQACGLMDFFVMDLASFVVANVLEVQENDRVLDMCAAPGGKALILAEKLGPNSQLVLNELSKTRFHRLKKVLESYVPQDVLERISFRSYDATKWGIYEVGAYDRILVDAPCSAEAHLLRNLSEMQKWSPKRSKRLAQRQYALLCSALLAARPESRIVYSTCSISPLENDGVLNKLKNKKGDLFEFEVPASPLGERTEFGWQILPDQHQWGPMYFSTLRKLGH